MRVRRNRSQGILLVCLGILLALFGVLAIGLQGRPGLGQYGIVLAGIPCALAGIAVMMRPLFDLRDRELVMHSLLGPKRRYRFDGASDLRVVRDRLVIGKRLLPIDRGSCDARDWAALVEKVSAAGASGARIPADP